MRKCVFQNLVWPTSKTCRPQCHGAVIYSKIQIFTYNSCVEMITSEPLLWVHTHTHTRSPRAELVRIRLVMDGGWDQSWGGSRVSGKVLLFSLSLSLLSCSPLMISSTHSEPQQPTHTHIYTPHTLITSWGKHCWWFPLKGACWSLAAVILAGNKQLSWWDLEY